MRSRTRWLCLLTVAVGCLVGCATLATIPPTTTSTVPATRVPTMEPTPQASSGARLSVTGAGSFGGFPSYYGCMASFLIDPGPRPLDRDATYDDPEFAVDRSADVCAVSGPAVGAPATLAPGTYRIGGATSLISDVASPGFARPQIMGGSVECSKELTVLPTMADVTIRVTFRDSGCRIDVATH